MNDLPEQYLGDFPAHRIAGQIADAAKTLKFRVRRAAASPFSRSAYVYCDKVKVRIADHPMKSLYGETIDVHTDPANKRAGSVSGAKAIRLLKSIKDQRNQQPEVGEL